MNNIPPSFGVSCVMVSATVAPCSCLRTRRSGSSARSARPARVAYRNPWLGLAVHLYLRFAEPGPPTPSLLWAIYGPRVRSCWDRTDYLGLRFESPAKRSERLAFWRRYRRAVRLEHGKSLKRQHRVTVETMIHDEGLLEQLPDDVTGAILEFLYKPTAADRRDERSYKQPRRRPRNSMTMTPDDWLDNHAGMGFLAAMVLPMFCESGGDASFQGDRRGRASREGWPGGPGGKWRRYRDSVTVPGGK